MTNYDIDTDTLGKQIASQVLEQIHGTILHVTKEEKNRLDGWFEYNGKIYGLEVKSADNDLFYGFPTMLIAKNKYDYSIGQGKEISGLTTTYMLRFTVLPNGDTDLHVCNFDVCQRIKPELMRMPNNHKPNSGHHLEYMYKVPLSLARHFEIIDNKVIEINEERQDERYGSSSIADGPRISCWSL